MADDDKVSGAQLPSNSKRMTVMRRPKAPKDGAKRPASIHGSVGLKPPQGKKKVEITILNARPMSEVGFRDIKGSGSMSPVSVTKPKPITIESLDLQSAAPAKPSQPRQIRPVRPAPPPPNKPPLARSVNPQPASQNEGAMQNNIRDSVALLEPMRPTTIHPTPSAKEAEFTPDNTAVSRDTAKPSSVPLPPPRPPRQMPVCILPSEISQSSDLTVSLGPVEPNSSTIIRPQSEVVSLLEDGDLESLPAVPSQLLLPSVPSLIASNPTKSPIPNSVTLTNDASLSTSANEKDVAVPSPKPRVKRSVPVSQATSTAGVEAAPILSPIPSLTDDGDTIPQSMTSSLSSSSLFETSPVEQPSSISTSSSSETEPRSSQSDINPKPSYLDQAIVPLSQPPSFVAPSSTSASSQPQVMPSLLSSYPGAPTTDSPSNNLAIDFFDPIEPSHVKPVPEEKEPESWLEVIKLLDDLDVEKEEEKSKEEKVQEQSTKEKVQEQSTKEKVQEQSTKEKVQEQSTKEKVQEQSTKEKVQEQSTKEKVQEQSTKEKVQEQSKEEKVQEQSKEEKVQEPGKEESTLDESTKPAGPLPIMPQALPKAPNKSQDDGEGELAIKNGDVTQNDSHVGLEMNKGKLHNNEGSFPLVEIKEDALGGSNVIEDPTANFVMAVFDFDGHDGELSFKVGDEIEVMGYVNSDWLFGQSGMDKGQFPAAFIEHVPPNLPAYVPKEPEVNGQHGHEDHSSQWNAHDSLFDHIDSGMKNGEHWSSSHSVHGDNNKETGIGYCTALHDYRDVAEGDLEFGEGDRIEVLEMVGDDWLRGRLAEREGMFPRSFVHMEEEYIPSSVPSTSVEHSVVYGQALHAFTGEAETDLSFQEGDVIELEEFVDESGAWRWGTLNGHRGMFPSDFVEVLH